MTRNLSVRTVLLLLTACSVAVAAVGLGFQSPVESVTAQQSPSLTVSTYNGEVAVEDPDVQYRGTAPGADSVVSVLIDANGSTVAMSGVTSPGGQFTQNVPLGDGERPLATGEARAFVLSSGEDGVFGTARDAPNSDRDLVQFVEALGTQNLSQAEVVDRLRQATSTAPGSDDAETTSRFTLANANTSITGMMVSGREAAVRQFVPGESIVVRGVTNRRPDRNNVRVTVTGGPSAGEFASPRVPTWTTDGVWTARIAVSPNIRPGSYTITAEDGASNDTIEIEVVAQRGQQATTTTTAAPAANETATPMVNETAAPAATETAASAANETTATATPTTTTTVEPTPTETETATTVEPTPTETETETTTTVEPTPTETATTTPGQPGFGVLVAVLATLLALVVRRRFGDR